MFLPNCQALLAKTRSKNEGFQTSRLVRPQVLRADEVSQLTLRANSQKCKGAKLLYFFRKIFSMNIQTMEFLHIEGGPGIFASRK